MMLYECHIIIECLPINPLIDPERLLTRSHFYKFPFVLTANDGPLVFSHHWGPPKPRPGPLIIHHSEDFPNLFTW